MEFNKDNWKDTDLNVDSLWLMGPRARGGKRDGAYHGNFAPQIPDEMIRRYTDEGDTVLEMFMGSGTTLFECERLGRNYIGFDINDEIINEVKTKMNGNETIKFSIHNQDITDTEKVAADITTDLKSFGKRNVNLIIAHPPYLDIIKFTDKPEDMSGISDISIFLDKFVTSVDNVFKYLKSRKYLVLVIGDLYRNAEVLPLGFYLMYAIKKHFQCQLKGIVVKDIVGNRAKIGLSNLWRYRALKNGNYIFKHEYIFVFKKGLR